jgi:hypothetical protein
VAARYADGLVTAEEAITVADQMFYGAPGHFQAACHAINSSFDYGYCPAEIGVKYPYGTMPAISCANEAAGEHGVNATLENVVAEMIPQCRFIYDIFGNPFNLVSLDPAWLTPTVFSLALAAYEERHCPAANWNGTVSLFSPMPWKKAERPARFSTTSAPPAPTSADGGRWMRASA